MFFKVKTMIALKCDTTQTHNRTKLKSLICDNSKTQNVTKLKKKLNNNKLSLNNIFCHSDKLWQLKNLNCDKTSIWYKTQSLTKLNILQNSISDKTQYLTKLNFWQNFYKKKVFLILKNNLTPWQQMRSSMGTSLQSCNFLTSSIIYLTKKQTIINHLHEYSIPSSVQYELTFRVLFRFVLGNIHEIFMMKWDRNNRRNLAN